MLQLAIKIQAPNLKVLKSKIFSSEPRAHLNEFKSVPLALMAAMVVMTIPAATMMVTRTISHLLDNPPADLDRCPGPLSVDPSKAAYLDDDPGGWSMCLWRDDCRRPLSRAAMVTSLIQSLIDKSSGHF